MCKRLRTDCEQITNRLRADCKHTANRLRTDCEQTATRLEGDTVVYSYSSRVRTCKVNRRYARRYDCRRDTCRVNRVEESVTYCVTYCVTYGVTYCVTYCVTYGVTYCVTSEGRLAHEGRLALRRSRRDRRCAMMYKRTTTLAKLICATDCEQAANRLQTDCEQTMRKKVFLNLLILRS